MKTKRRSLPKSEGAEMSPDAITLQYRRAAPLEMDEAFSGSLSFRCNQCAGARELVFTAPHDRRVLRRATEMQA